MSLNVLILGVNGFIGSHLAEAVLTKTDWTLHGFDIKTDNLAHCLNHPRFHFNQGDIRTENDYLDKQIKAVDVMLPLVAIATPATYVKEPLKIFELDFEANLKVIRMAQQHQTRVIFPSTSEVYGMSPDIPFDEYTSNLTYGPIEKERWIYACGKQMLDRVIYAMGKHQQLDYTLFRPFNWFGPRLDNPLNTERGSSRALTQFIGNIIRGENIELVDGGEQMRAFIYVDDCVEALLKIIENKNNQASQEIFNIGYPEEEYSIRQLAEFLIEEIKQYPTYKDAAEKTKLISTSSTDYYGKGYQDVSKRVPSIKNIQQKLQWQPKTSLRDGIRKTLAFYFGCL